VEEEKYEHRTTQMLVRFTIRQERNKSNLMKKIIDVLVVDSGDYELGSYFLVT
jgi:hypothetical protein